MIVSKGIFAANYITYHKTLYKMYCSYMYVKCCRELASGNFSISLTEQALLFTIRGTCQQI